MVKHNINEIVLDIDDLEPNPWNPNEESEFMRERLAGSLKKYGQVAEVLVREIPGAKYQIIDGEHRWRKIKKAGGKEILANNLGKISEEDAKMLTMVANELHGNRNPVRLAKILRDLQRESDWKEIAAILPYTEIEIENLLDIDPDAAPPPEFFEASTRKKPGADDQSWVDIKLSIPAEKASTVESMLESVKRKMKIKSRPDKALENGELLKKILITSS